MCTAPTRDMAGAMRWCVRARASHGTDGEGSFLHARMQLLTCVNAATQLPLLLLCGAAPHEPLVNGFMHSALQCMFRCTRAFSKTYA